MFLEKINREFFPINQFMTLERVQSIETPNMPIEFWLIRRGSFDDRRSQVVLEDGEVRPNQVVLPDEMACIEAIVLNDDEFMAWNERVEEIELNL